MGLAIVFPGQGSQSVGMLAELLQTYPVVRDTFAAASAVLGYDLEKLTQEGPAEDLNRTDHTQPAMLAAGVAVWRVWRQRGGARPTLLAGHSLGEYTALVCANAVDFEEAVALVADRGRFMQEAVPEGEGAMAAILGLDDATVGAVCSAVAEGQVVSPVNFNSPGQVVVAGAKSAVERAVAEAKRKGAKRALLLPVSVPSHCDLMQPAADRLLTRLQEVAISPPDVPVLHNVDAATRDGAEAIREALARQLHSPVRWADTVRAMLSPSVGTVVELGPGKVLAGLSRRIERTVNSLAVLDNRSLDTALAEVGVAS